MKNTKKALFMSALSMLLCLTMLVGSTFAWFTDTVTAGRNVIIAGNLDVELWHSNGKATDEMVSEKTELFVNADGSEIKWEPGVMAYENFTVKNVGTLALKYSLKVNVGDYNTVKDTELSLKDVLKVAVLDEAFSGTREDALALKFEKIDDFSKGGTINANADGEKHAVIIYWEPSANDNDYNLSNLKASSDGNDLFIELGVNLVATQANVENDSFDSDYDLNATFPVLNAKDFKRQINEGGVIQVSESFSVENKNAPASRNSIGADTVMNLGDSLLTFRNTVTDEEDYNNELYNISALYVDEHDLTLSADDGGIDSDFYGINLGTSAHDTNPTVIINGGIYKAGSVVNVSCGTVIINGGFFDGRSIYGSGKSARYLLNCVDSSYKAGIANIIVNGGIFVNFNPANNSAEGANTNFVADGYKVVSKTEGADTFYAVIANDDDEASAFDSMPVAGASVFRANRSDNAENGIRFVPEIECRS